MLQRLHLLIVNAAREAALAARYGDRWLLPSFTCGERARAALIAERWCVDRGIRGDIAGQWLGQMGPDAIHWLVVISTEHSAVPDQMSLEWIAVSDLASGRSVLDYQSWALGRCVERSTIPSVAGPFGRLDWPDRMREWIEQRVGVPCRTWTPYRVSAYEVVAGADTARGRIYCKGLSGPRAIEAATTERLAAVMPESFARTNALDVLDGGTVWWITGECRGRPADDPVLVGEALATVQRRVYTETGEPWIPMDLDPANVLVHDGRVAFIDLDDSFTGPPPLAMAGFALRCGGDRGGAYRAYERAWPQGSPIAWEAFERAALMFQTWCGWTRFRQHVERGELVADVELVERRIRARAERVLYRG
jgi:hypothetical protein